METCLIGKRGTVVLPANIRERFNVKEGDLFIVEEHDDGIILRPAVAVPIESILLSAKPNFSLTTPSAKKTLTRRVRIFGLWD